ncbi:MAG: beta-hexosaminidase [Alphaproteobacteria bacterium]|nr:MAG: beta-hexosaminidase [Alphaproteobacteria bacterium]
MPINMRSSMVFVPLLLLALVFWLAGCAPEGKQEEAAAPTAILVEPALVPAPASLVRGDGDFELSKDTGILIPEGDEAARAIAVALGRRMADTVGLAPAVLQGGEPAGNISLKRGGPSGEAYSLTVAEDGVTIEAQDDAGLYYGATTFWQLAGNQGAARILIPVLQIEDKPRLQWRGAMLDVSRHFRDTDFVKQFIDWMATNKLNTFHWHLSDDQAWRLEIKKYPKLTEVGAWRVPAGDAARADIDPATGQPRLYGGFYTQDQVRDVVAYAAARFITIVPEIDLPGHASAAVAAYPELGTEPVGAVPSDWGIYYSTFNLEAGTMTFLEDVMDEVLALFPGTFVHIGGDEVATDQWQHSARIKERMAELGLKDVHDIQPYFTSHFSDYLRARGRRLIGWDEILEGGATGEAAIMSWRGTAGGVAAAKAGRQVVMAPAPIYYMDYRQSDLPDEPPARDHIQTLKDVYDFEPVSDELTADEKSAVLGAEFTIFTEHMRLAEQVEHMAFPRGFALAETVWSPPSAKNFDDFVQRLMPHLARMRALGLRPADSAFVPKITLGEAADGQIVVSLSKQVAAGAFRYTLDGARPTSDSALYDAPFAAPVGSTLKVATFNGDQMLAAVRTKALDQNSLRFRAEDELSLCSSTLAIKLVDDAPTDGPREGYLVDIVEPCWIYDAPLMKGVTAIDIAVANLPYNFQIGDLIKKVKLGTPETRDGEIVVYKDTCDTGEELARLPLAPATQSFGITKLHASLKPASDARALCFRVAASHYEPLWAIHEVQLLTGE